jgi:hypothetical protein
MVTISVNMVYIAEQDIIKEGEAKLRISPSQSISVIVFPPTSNESGLGYRGYTPTDSIGDGLLLGNPLGKCNFVVFKIPNFPQYTGKLIQKDTAMNASHPMMIQYKDRDGIDWQIEIKKVDNNEDVNLKLNGDDFGGYAITHFGTGLDAGQRR